MQLHTTFHYPPTPPVEGESPDKLQSGAVEAMSQLALPDGALHEDYSKVASSQSQLSSASQQPPQHFQSLPTPPTPELTVAALQNGGHGGAAGAAELQAVSVNQATCAPASGPAATYGAALADQCKPLYQWQGSNLCAVMGMGHPQFAPAAATAFPTRRPPPLYYQAAEKTSMANAASAQTGPLRSPMSEFVVMKECMDGERGRI